MREVLAVLVGETVAVMEREVVAERVGVIDGVVVVVADGDGEKH